MTTQRKSFLGAVKEFFGLLPGQSLREFSAELKRLTLDDRLELAVLLRSEGFDCDEPKAA